MEEKLIVKEDMICPVTKKHCDDECCTVGSECNVQGNEAQPVIPNYTIEDLQEAFDQGVDHSQNPYKYYDFQIWYEKRFLTK